MIYFERKNLLNEVGKFPLQIHRAYDGVSFYQAKTERIDIELKELVFLDFSICEVRLNVMKRTTIVTAHKPGIVITIPLVNDLSYSVIGLGDGELLKNHFNILYTPAATGKYHFTKGTYKFFCILFEFSYVNKWRTANAFLCDFLDSTDAKKVAMLSRTQLPATNQMSFLAEQLFLVDKPLPEMNRHAIALAFLRESISQCISQPIDPSNSEFISERDSLKIEEVKEYITRNFAKHFTLNELATLVNMSRRKLMYVFKRNCGQTISEYWMQERMKRANDLLLKTDMYLNKVAKQLGYPNQSNFSLAFKNYYKLSPKDYRQKYQFERKMERAKQLLQESNLSVGDIGRMLGYTPVKFGAVFKRHFHYYPQIFRSNSLKNDISQESTSSGPVIPGNL